MLSNETRGVFTQFILFLFLLLPTPSLFSQNSYVRKLSAENFTLSGIVPIGIGKGENDDLSIMLFNVPAFVLLNLSPTGDVTQSFQIATTPSINWRPRRYKRIGDYHLVACDAGGNGQMGKSALFIVNTENGTQWAKQTYNQHFVSSTASITQSDKILISHYISPSGVFMYDSLGLSLLDLSTGDEIWSYYYRPIETNNFPQKRFRESIETFSNGDFSILDFIAYTGNVTNKFSLLRISPDGDFVKSVILANYTLNFYPSHTIDESDNLYLSGRTHSPTLDYDEGFIVKMDSDYNVIWAKKLTAEAFPFYDLKIKSFPGGELMFTYVTYGDIPIISGKISADGELLWHKGYAFYNPNILIGQDNSLYFASGKRYYADSTIKIIPVVAKTDPNGVIEECDQFDACLALIDLELTVEEWEWERSDAPTLPSYEVTTTPIDFTSTPYCDDSPSPKADFSFPDTLCQYSCASPTEIKNRLANYIEWTLSGPNIDTTFIDTTFNWCFDSTGTYTIEQEIWLLGCSEFFTQTLEVLPDNLVVSLGEDRFICETPYTLIPEGSRPLQTFSWQNGSQNSTLPVLQSGEYALTATDGYCSNKDTVLLTRIEEWLDEVPLTLPPDETVCPDLLPFILRPQSPYNSIFYLNNSQQDSVFRLNKGGIYTISTEIENCIFSKNFELSIQECKVPIYIANTFSPNNDGINDLIFPQGLDFEGIQIEIFNRWGDILFQSKTAPFTWDGTFGNQKANAGVYVLVFTYFNQRNLTEEVVSQDILLMR